MDWVVRNWLIVAVTLLLLSSLANLLEGTPFYWIGALLLGLGWWAAALLALMDGLWRALGRPSLLGSGQGFNRLLALLQILLAVLLLASLASLTL